MRILEVLGFSPRRWAQYIQPMLTWAIISRKLGGVEFIWIDLLGILYTVPCFLIILLYIISTYN